MFRILIALFLVGVVACSNDKKEGALPAPGQERRPQIYLLSDAKHPLAPYWGFPSPASLRDGLEARVESAEVSDAAKAEELLREWNTRPIDVWLLGPGIPQELFAKLRLTGAPGRKILFVGSEKAPATEGVRPFFVNSAELNGYFVDLCREKWASCRAPKSFPGSLEPGNRKVAWNNEDTEAWALIEIQWLRAFKEMLKAPPTSTPFRLDFFSGFVAVKAGPRMSGEDKTQFELFRKNHMMKALSNAEVAP